MSQLPWNERITQLSIHPDAASREDIARLASELLGFQRAQFRMRNIDVLEAKVLELSKAIKTAAQDALAGLRADVAEKDKIIDALVKAAKHAADTIFLLGGHKTEVIAELEAALKLAKGEKA